MEETGEGALGPRLWVHPEIPAVLDACAGTIVARIVPGGGALV